MTLIRNQHEQVVMGSHGKMHNMINALICNRTDFLDHIH